MESAIPSASINSKAPTNIRKRMILIRLLADVVSKNGNLLLNVGPCADGGIHPAQQAALEGLGDGCSAMVSPSTARGPGAATRIPVRTAGRPLYISGTDPLRHPPQPASRTAFSRCHRTSRARSLCSRRARCSEQSAQVTAFWSPCHLRQECAADAGTQDPPDGGYQSLTIGQ